jgi:hypothetical protein
MLKPVEAWALITKKNRINPLDTFDEKTKRDIILRRDEKWQKVIIKPIK